MTYKLFLAGLMSFLCLVLCSAQDDYRPLEARGSIPKAIIQPSIEKYEIDIKTIKADLSKKEKKASKEFFLKSNFSLDDFLKSGYVLFNDELTTYLQRITNKLLENEPRLKGKVKVYATRSMSMNAFATDRGEIFVNLGLVARLENEAQLAFILAHEIGHIVEKHSLELFVEKDKISGKDKGLFRGTDYESQVLQVNRYSQKNEEEADDYGLQLFLSSNYSTQNISRVFDLLERSYLPIEEQEFDPMFIAPNIDVAPFSTPELGNPITIDSLVSDSTHTEEEHDHAHDHNHEHDGLSTHPAIEVRKASIEKKIGEGQTKGGFYLISERDFVDVKRIARFEMAASYIENFDYPGAIYILSILQKENLHEKHVKLQVAKALYLYAKNALLENEYINNFELDYKQGEQYSVYYNLSKNEMSAHKAGILATNYLWELKKDYPKDQEINRYANDMALELGVHHANAVDILRKYKNWDTLLDNKKIKEKDKNLVKKVVNDDFMKAAYAKLLKDQAFVTIVRKGKSEKSKRKRLDKKKKKLLGYASPERGLGAKNVLLVTPKFNYTIHNIGFLYRRGVQKNYQKTEEMGKLYRTYLREAATTHKVQMDVLSPDDFTEKDVEKYNDLRQYRQWLTEKIIFNNNYILTSNNQLIQNKIKGSKYDRIIWTGLHTVHTRGLFLSGYPRRSIYYTFVMNTKSGEVDLARIKVFPSFANKSSMKANLYELFYILKTKQKI